MKQLAQKLKSGEMKILEVPLPTLKPGSLLVQSYFSCISAGTEGSTVRAARKGYIGKAKERPEQAKQVIDSIREKGPIQTYRAVMKKLDAYSPLGYSSVGQVIDLDPALREFKINDFVACGGLSAAHAEVNCIPSNLCVKVDSGADFKQAAFNTPGAIALQGVRQADLRLGESCAVIGLGLLGQLTAILLKASGIKVVGIDIDDRMVKIASEHCADLAIERDASGIENAIQRFTEGQGCDAVIITAASNSTDPINFAGAIARKKGTIVISGAVPAGFDREPFFYQKELQIRMSCSYGPGRYDPNYEEKGIDYPYAYVRWTEKRNMMAFQDLINSKSIDVSYLISHVYNIDDASDAYKMMIDRSEPFTGILIEYNRSKKFENKPIFISNLKSQSSSPGAVSIGFIGAGSYAQSHLLPNIPENNEVDLKGVMTATGTSSRSVADRFGFEFCTNNEKDILDNDDINTVFITTRHDSHAKYVLNALNAGKHVFIEKPLCLNETELGHIVEDLNRINKNQAIANGTNQQINHLTSFPILMVGYNRRFSPLARIIKDKFGNEPMAMIYRVNAGAVPPDSWIQDPDIGGGRIIGEVCHFVDFLTYVNGSLPKSVHANVLSDPNHLNDTLNASLSYENGSIGAISYFANGDKSLPKERIEIFVNGCSAVIDDFKSLSIHAGGKKTTKKLLSQNKGQKDEVRNFLDSILKGQENPIPLDEIYSTSCVTFKIIESIRTGEAIPL